MARLYRYVDSNEKSGYFIIGDDGNATFQLTPIGQRLFEELGYNPPTKTEGQGPQVPAKLHWALYDIGWIFTGDGDAGVPASIEDLTGDGVTESLTDEMLAEIQQFIENRDGGNAEDLAERLGLQKRESRADRLCTLDEAKQEDLEQYVYGFIEAALTSVEEMEIAAVDVTYLDLGDDPALSSLNVKVEPAGEEPTFRHSVFSNEKEGVISAVSATEAPQSWEERGKIDRQRGHLFDAIATASNDPKIDLEFTEDEVRGDVTYEISFNGSISMPD